MSGYFGLSPIKRWLDSGEWINNIPDFHQLLPHDQDELVNTMHQAAMGTFIRNWIQIIIFLLYVYNSSSPYPMTNCIFARDEYQPNTGN